MTVKTCYDALQGDYDDVMARFFDEGLVSKFAKMFIKDSSYNDLCVAIQAGDVEKAFRAAHTMKGVCANLAFTPLLKSSSEITEVLRNKDMQKAKEMLPKIRQNYETTIEALKTL